MVLCGRLEPGTGGQATRASGFAISASFWHEAHVIPDVAHFVWFGTKLPWVHRVAIESALRAGGFSRAVLHHEAGLERGALGAIAGLELRVIDSDRWLRACGVDGAGLLELYARLQAPAARANVLRAAILAVEGGVYLDLDTVSVAPFAQLRAANAFCGLERVAFPARLRSSGTRAQWCRAYALSAARDVLRRLPHGHVTFRRIEAHYDLAANNAVLGARAGHALPVALLDGMLRIPRAQQLRRYALGTHLLQQTLARSGPSDVVLHPPAVFYPLAPEISEHWLRMRRRIELASALQAQTRLVHWYASVRTRKLVPHIDPEFVRRHQGRQLLSALLAPYAGG